MALAADDRLRLTESLHWQLAIVNRLQTTKTTITSNTMTQIQLAAARAAMRQLSRFASRNNGWRSSPLLCHRAADVASSITRSSSANQQWFNTQYHQVSFMSTEAAKSDDSSGEEMEFQAETRQLLDIVTHSLYTDKEVFLRELVSNASDALEKLRHVQATGTISGSGGDQESSIPLEIRITTDEASNTLTITDTGIGMTKEEMVSNLGTIARSGSKAFVHEMNLKAQGADPTTDVDPFGEGIIGRFGVGFYSGFMVSDKVDVRSKSAGKVSNNETEITESNDEPIVWESTGTGKYSISALSEDIRQDRGTSVVLHLKPELSQYSNESTIETILKKYSNFVGFPIFLNGNR
eukprot:scaffold9326_cov96-Skeletonema_dohrnii-CCMP3373.AAC.1